MHWIIFTILAVLFRAVYSLATRVLAVRIKVSAASQTVLLTGMAFVMSLILSPFLGGVSFGHFHEVWIAVIVIVLSSALGNIFYFKGQESLDAGTTQIAFSSIVIWGALLSLTFLGSHFSFLQIFGILLLLFAIILIQYRKSNYTFRSAIFYVVAAAFFFAIFQVSSASVAKILSAGTTLPLQYLGTAVVVAIFYWKRISKDFGEIKHNYQNVFKYGLFASSTALLYYLFSYIAYSVAPDRGVVVLLLITQVIVSVILGIIFLKERDRMTQKILAGVLAVVASILIKA